jgi:tRNA 2-selenouridine synthase SelU
MIDVSRGNYYPPIEIGGFKMIDAFYKKALLNPLSVLFIIFISLCTRCLSMISIYFS